MLEQMDYEVLSYLFNWKEGPIERISQMLNSNNTDIKGSINRINDFLNHPIYTNNANVSLIDKHVDHIYQYIKNDWNDLYRFFSIENRRSIYIIYLLTCNEYISLLDLADLLSVSKNTALSDLNYLKQQLKENKIDIHINYSRKNGYVMEGDEFALRLILNKAVSKILNVPIGKYILFKLGIIDQNEITLLKQKLGIIEKRLSITVSDEMFEVLPYTILLIVKRIENFKVHYKFESEFNELKDSKEYITISSIFWNYDFLEENDLEYLVLLILSSNMVKKRTSTTFIPKRIQGIEQTTEQFITVLENRLAIKFSNKKKLKKALIQHIVPAIYRNLLGLQIVNPLANQFIEEHHAVNVVIQNEMKYFEKFTNKRFSNDEIAYITMIVLSNIIENKEATVPKTFTGVVVCKSGTSISKLLTEQLKGLFPNIAFKEVMSLREFEKDGSNSDFIFSTIPINNQKNVFLVSSFMTQEEQWQLKTSVNEIINVDKNKKTRDVLSYISEYLKDGAEDKVTKKLLDYFKQEETIENPIVPFLHSTYQITIIKEDIVDWNQLIEFAFQELLNRHSITKKYVEVCERIFAQVYDSLLISPGVLIPHAPTDEGVQVPDVQINLFEHPIIGPNAKPYQLVIALAPGENNEHLDWLIKLNNQLMDHNFRGKIFQSTDKETLLNLLQ